ncbi:MAG: tetratricopeptide repeat protein [Polyangiales bacterium]
MRRIGLLVLLASFSAGVATAVVAQQGGASGGNRPASGASSVQAPPVVCVAPSFQTAINECPTNAPRIQAPPSGQPRASAVTAVQRPQEPQAQQTRGPGFEISRAQAMNREEIQARQLELLQREVETARRIVRNTQPSNPQRPELLRRLAETYFEMQQALTQKIRSLDEPIFANCTTTPNPQQCQSLQQQQQQLEAQLTEARNNANGAYAQLITEHPNYRRMDEVLFSLAFGLEEMNQMDSARQVYLRLIKDHPESRFIPHAYLSFGEYYFGTGEMQAALQFYQRVTEFPPERNSIYGYALYKTAWTQYNLQDFRGSLESFAAVIDFARQHPEAADAQNLVRQARRELVMPYSRIGTPERALDVFMRYAENRDGALDMLESLAELYFDTGQWDKTIATYHRLMAEAPQSDKLCGWEGKITNAVLNQGNKNNTVQELARLTRVYETFVGETHPDTAKNECKAATAAVLFTLATQWHVEAVGTEDHPGTNDRATMTQAADLYQMLLAQFPDMENLEYPEIRREDWPSKYKVAYYYADLLYKAQDWQRCGPAFDQVVSINPQGEFTSDAAYAAVLCYNNLYQSQYQGRERQAAGDAQPQTPQPAQQAAPAGRRGRRGAQQQQAAAPTEAQAQFARREFTQLEQGMLRAFSNYVCVAGAQAEDMAQIKYRRARIYYEANAYEEAALLFRDIAYNHRDSEYSEYAANLYLDCLNIIGTRRTPNVPECVDEIEANIEPMSSLYCSSDSDRSRYGELCPVLENLTCQVKRKRAEALQSAGRFREAAQAYIALFRRNRTLPADQQCGAMDEILYNAAINYESAHLVGKAIRVRRALIGAYPESPLSKRAIYFVGANYHALAYYPEASEWYERFATQYAGEDGSQCTEQERNEGRCAVASEALMNATLFRLGLAQEEQAIADADLFQRNYARTMPRETAQVYYAVGQLYEHREQWDKVVLYYRRYIRDFSRMATPHQLIMANVAVGRAYIHEEKPDDAKDMFDAAVRLWNGGAPQAIARMTNISQGEQIRMLRESVDATSEALFYLAERKYRAFEAIRFPRYSGGRNMQRVQQWSQTEFRRWVEQKMAALRAAEADYAKIAQVRVPIENGVILQSAAWQVAAASRVGVMYRQFVDSFREAPVPEEIENDYELYNVYVGALEEQSEPLLRQATEAFLFCLRTATNVRWFNEYSRQCEQELNRLNPREYPIAAELRGPATNAFETPGTPGVASLGRPAGEEDEGDQQ